MPYLHLSLQAGNDLILKRMKRRHTRQQTIEFCEKVKLNYVSCSPYRVPVARLAAAQAYLKKKKY